MPTFSIVMPTYNTPEAYLREAIESIISQTFEDWELIIIDDGSIESDYSIASSYSDCDNRIKVYKNDTNMGVAATLNKGLKYSKGKYIARMDADDISQKDRLKITYKYLEENLDVDLVGSWRNNFGNGSGKKSYYTDNSGIRASMLFATPFTHPTVCFRGSSLEKYNLKYDTTVKAEDYDLWYRCATIKDFKFSNIEKVLLQYRIHEKQVTQVGNNIKISTQSVIKKVLEFVECELSDIDFKLYLDFCYTTRQLSKEEFQAVAKIFKQLINSKIENLCPDRERFLQVVEERFAKSTLRHFIKYKTYDKSTLQDIRKICNSKISFKLNFILKITNIFV